MSAAESEDLIDVAQFRAAPLARSPFDHLVLDRFVPTALAVAAGEAFPDIPFGGIVPAPEGNGTDALGRLLTRLREPATTRLFAEKYGLALDPAELMITLRAHCRRGDGKIHPDSETKLVTALIYLNATWPHEGGRLRILRGPRDLEDYSAEVTPLAGTLITFRRSDHSYHGHHSFEGERKVIMLNWMVGAAMAKRELFRHAISRRLKRLVGAA